MLEHWTQALREELGITDPVDIELLLDLTKDVAHNVARPAAPLTAFMVGLAAGKAGAAPDSVLAASDKARALALHWTGGTD